MVRDKVTHMFFGADVAYNATGMSDLDAGEIIAIDKGGNILSPAAITNLGGDDIFYLVEGKRGGNVSHIISPKLTKNGIKAHRGTSYSADVQQVTYIGSNGTTGSINTIADVSTEYSLSVSFEWDKDLYSQRRNHKTYSYTSDSSATQTEVANAFIALMNADKDFASQAVASLETQSSNAGIKITGKAQAVPQYSNPSIVSFTVALDKGFDSSTRLDEKGFVYLNNAAATTSGATSVAPQLGVGTYAIMSAMERNNNGFQNGVTNNRKFPIVAPESRVSGSGTYDVYVIDFADTHLSQEIGLDATRTTQGQIIIANNIATTVNGTTAAIEALLFAITGKAVNL
jgi:hypothetical protein